MQMTNETNATTTITVDTLPIATLRQRAVDVRRILRDARRNIGAVGGLAQLDAALDATEALLPGLMDRASRNDALLAVVRRLRPTERVALRRALVTGQAIERALVQELADVAPAAVIEAIERVEIYEEIAAEVLAVLRTLEIGCRVAC